MLVTIVLPMCVVGIAVYLVKEVLSSRCTNGLDGEAGCDTMPSTAPWLNANLGCVASV